MVRSAWELRLAEQTLKALPGQVSSQSSLLSRARGFQIQVHLCIRWNIPVLCHCFWGVSPLQTSSEGTSVFVWDSRILRSLDIIPCYSTSGTPMILPVTYGMVSSGQVLRYAVCSVWEQVPHKLIKPPPPTQRRFYCSEVKEQSRLQWAFTKGGLQ